MNKALQFVVGVLGTFIGVTILWAVLMLFTSAQARADHTSDLIATGGLCDYAHRVLIAGAYFRDNSVPFDRIKIQWHGDESPDDVALFLTYLRRGYYSIDDSGKHVSPLAYEARRLQVCRDAARSQLP